MTTVSNIVSLGQFTTSDTLQPLGINGEGQVTGSFGNLLGGGLGTTGFFWSGTSLVALTPAKGATATEAYGINNQGEVVGSSFPSATSQNIGQACLWATPGVTGSACEILSPLSGDLGGLADGINNDGWIIGVSTGSNAKGVVWRNGSPTDLGSLGGGATQPYQINDAGQIVGRSNNASNSTHAFVWQNGVMTDLGTLPRGTISSANAISTTGEIVGASNTFGDATNTDPGIPSTHAVAWQNGKIIDLGVLANIEYQTYNSFNIYNNSSVANSVNASGEIVGQTIPLTGLFIATLWADNTIIDLNSLLPANSGWYLSNATVINDAGQVSGTGIYNNSSLAFELTLPSQITVSATTAITNNSYGFVFGPVNIGDSAADISSNLDALQTLATANHLGTIVLTDGSIPSLSMTPAQASTDTAALAAITSNFSVKLIASGSNLSITGVANALGSTVIFGGNTSQYSITPAGDGVHFTVTTTGSSDQISKVQALQFADHTLIVAAAPSTSSVTAGNITELYGAVFGRLPDVPGLSYYQQELASNPSLSLTALAQNFLQSPEYVNNIAHDYAQTTAGDTQFITDLYQNLLHRAPAAGDAAWYEANVIVPIVGNATPGTAGYTAVLLQAHAAVVTDFSASAEFLGDVQVTASHPPMRRIGLCLSNRAYPGAIRRLVMMKKPLEMTP